jgi:hypothetical protein
MQQLELKYFYPLTEQIPLDLDFNPCLDYEEYKRKESLYTGTQINYWTCASTAGTITTSQPIFNSFVVKPNKVHIGKWEISESMFVYRSTKPNVITRFFAKLLLGFKWHDEI